MPGDLMEERRTGLSTFCWPPHLHCPLELAPSSRRTQAFWQVDAQRRLFFALGHTVKLGDCEPTPSFQDISLELNHHCHWELVMSGWGVGVVK